MRRPRSKTFDEVVVSQSWDYAIDSWWRDQFKTPYGSPLHASASAITQMVDFSDFVYKMMMRYDREIKEYEEAQAAMPTEDETAAFLEAMGVG